MMKEIRERLDYMEDYLAKRNLLTDALEEERRINGKHTRHYEDLWEEFEFLVDEHERNS